MSLNRENVTWQSPDGTWSRGFYDYHQLGYSRDGGDDEPDYEWDVEYDYGQFNWVSSGHPTADAANAAWDGSNPGSSTRIAYDPGDSRRVQEITGYDLMAADLEAEYRRREAERRARGERSFWYGGTNIYNGASKMNLPHVRKARLARAATQVADLTRSREYYRLNGYANDVTKPLAEAEKTYAALRKELLADGTMSGTEIRDTDVALLSALHQALSNLIEETTEARRPRGGYYGGYGRPAPPSLQPTIELRDKTAAALETARKSRPRAPKPATGGSSGRQGRQPAGIPVGGQFAKKTQGRSGVSL